MGYEVVDWIQFFENNVVKDFVILFFITNATVNL